jgi:hypothetical protein
VRPGLNVTWSCGCTTWVHPRTKTKPRITPTGGSFGFCNTRAHQLVRAASSSKRRTASEHAPVRLYFWVTMG